MFKGQRRSLRPSSTPTPNVDLDKSPIASSITATSPIAFSITTEVDWEAGVYTHTVGYREAALFSTTVFYKDVVLNNHNVDYTKAALLMSD